MVWFFLAPFKHSKKLITNKWWCKWNNKPKTKESSLNWKEKQQKRLKSTHTSLDIGRCYVYFLIVQLTANRREKRGIIIWMAQNNGHLTSEIRKSTYASEEKASEIKTQTHVIDKSVEWSILFVLIVPTKNTHRKRKRNDNIEKLFDVNVNYKKNDTENIHSNGKLNQFSVICTVIYQKLSTTLNERRNRNFYFVVTNKQAPNNACPSDINRSIVVLDNFWFRRKQRNRIQLLMNSTR